MRFFIIKFLMNQQQRNHSCHKCNKKYTQYRSLYVHLKVKHNDVREIKNISLRNFEFQEHTFFQTEDQLLMLLSQLSQKYAYSLETLIQTNLYDPKNNAPGKNHFSSNSITNNPYQIADYEQQIRFNLDQLKTLNSRNNINKQIVIIDVQKMHLVLSQQYDRWLFSDPHDDQIDFSNQFSLDNIPKLIKNLQSRNLNLQIPQVAILILWISRYLKKDAFNDMCKVILFLYQQKIQFQKRKIISKNAWLELHNNLNKDPNFDNMHRELDISFKKDEFKKIVNVFTNWLNKVLKLVDIYSGQNQQ